VVAQIGVAETAICGPRPQNNVVSLSSVARLYERPSGLGEKLLILVRSFLILLKSRPLNLSPYAFLGQTSKDTFLNIMR
jgi:hypothetical protein